MGGLQPRASVSLWSVGEQQYSGSSTSKEPSRVLQEYDLTKIRDMTALKPESLISFGAPALDLNGT